MYELLNKELFYSSKNQLNVVKNKSGEFIAKVVNKIYKQLLIIDPINKKIIPKELYFLRLLNESGHSPKVIDFHENESSFTVIIEYLNDNWVDLFSFVDIQREERIVKQIIRNVIITLEKLSKIGIYHVDIKQENIMVNVENYAIKMIDFEDAIFDCSQSATSNMWVGTLGYRSPETYKNICYDIKSSQVFSIGCLIYSCLELKRPYDSEEDVLRNRRKESYHSSKLALDLMDKCMEMDPEDRIQFNQITSHDWF